MLAITVDTDSDSNREVRATMPRASAITASTKRTRSARGVAPTICASIEIGREKLVDEIPVRTVDLGRVEPGLLRPANGMGKGQHQLFDLMFGERMGTERLEGSWTAEGPITAFGLMPCRVRSGNGRPVRNSVPLRHELFRLGGADPGAGARHSGRRLRG